MASLISEPNFMKSRSRRMILLSTHKNYLQLIDGNVSGWEYYVNNRVVNFGSVFKDASVLGTFNGIVLVALSQFSFSYNTRSTSMILYNPLTQAFKKVPDPLCPFNYDASSYAVGFGYGATPDDLKIVRIEVDQRSDGELKGAYRVFDLKKSVWSTPQDFTPAYRFMNGVAGVFLNGYLYWAAYRYDEKLILALNVKEMVFSEIVLPHQSNIFTNIILGLQKGCLCMILSKGCNESNLWVMKEQGVKNSWSKALSFKNGGVDYRHSVPSTVHILEEGRILIVDMCGQHFIYDTSNLKDTSTLQIGLEGQNNLGIHGIEFVESLVSPSDICGA